MSLKELLFSDWNSDLHIFGLLPFLDFIDGVRLSQTTKSLMPPRQTPWPHDSVASYPWVYRQLIKCSGWAPVGIIINNCHITYIPPTVKTIHCIKYNPMYVLDNIGHFLPQLERLIFDCIDRTSFISPNSEDIKDLNWLNPKLKVDFHDLVEFWDNDIIPKNWTVECVLCGGNHYTFKCNSCIVCKHIHTKCPNCNVGHPYTCVSKTHSICHKTKPCVMCNKMDIPTHTTILGKRVCANCDKRVCRICWAVGHSTHQHRCPCGKHKKYEIKFVQNGKFKTLPDRVFWNANRTHNTEKLEKILGSKFHNLRPHAGIVQCICPK